MDDRPDPAPPPALVFDDFDDSPGSPFEFDVEAYRAAVRVGIAQADRGEAYLVPHERVREWLLALVRGERRSPPRPDRDPAE